MKILRQLYDWTLDKADHPKASWFLSFISFIESSIFPIPPDIILIPMIIANRIKAWRYALICTLSSVIGAIAEIRNQSISLGLILQKRKVFASNR